VREDFSAWWIVGSAVTLPLVRIVFRVRVRGIEHVPVRGPAILAFNHVSVLDGPVLAIVTAARRRREIRFLVAAEVFRKRLAGPILRGFDQIPIHRGRGDTRALDAAIEAVREGAVAAIAPEGHVAEHPEQGLQRIRSGCARIALPTGAPVIPVCVWGTQLRWPSSGPVWTRPWRRQPLAISYGPPIRAEPGDDPESFGVRIGEAISEQVRRVREPA
jgi:1-acyl-sn-glycerol-3-phosphate acyltransferase